MKKFQVVEVVKNEKGHILEETTVFEIPVDNFESACVFPLSEDELLRRLNGDKEACHYWYMTRLEDVGDEEPVIEISYQKDDGTYALSYFGAYNHFYLVSELD